MISQNKLLYIATAIAFVTACSKPDINDQGLTQSDLNAEFTVTPVSGAVNRYVLIAKDSSYIFSKWNIDDAGDAPGRAILNLWLPDAGPYTVVHTAVGKGGTMVKSSQTINVAASDPSAPNLVQGGRFATVADEGKWTKLNISPGVTWAAANGKMNVAGGNGGHAAIYQAITVQANKDYRFSMTVSGSGATDTWFEVYFGTVAPTAGADYSSGGNQIGLNTWEGCGKSTFIGNINDLACVGDIKGKAGIIRFATGGTKYLLIKSGGSNLGTTGITVDNIELRPKS